MTTDQAVTLIAAGGAVGLISAVVMAVIYHRLGLKTFEQQLAAFLDAQPGSVQTIFRDCPSLMMVEAGKMKLVTTTPGDEGAVCTFETVAGDVFSIAKPPLSEEQEMKLIEQLREILDDEGLE